MNHRTRVHRLGSLIVALILMGSAGLAQAGEVPPNTVDFTVNAVESSAVCSVTTSAVETIPVSRWTASTGDVLWDQVNASGPLTLTFDSTGSPGDRNCYSSASNTDFKNGDVTFLYANTLSMSGSSGPAVYIGSTSPKTFLSFTNIPEGGVTANLTWYVLGWPADVPAGTYTSTFVITLSSSPL